jgi:flagellar FliJ protein
MNRYRFRLESVLRVRRAEEELARQELARANGRLRAAMEVFRRESQRYGELQSASGVLDPTGFRRERAYADLAAATVEAARTVMDAAAEQAAGRYVAWSEAASLVAALERLDDRRRAEHRDEARRAEVAEADDMTSARFATAERVTAGSGGLRRSGALT